MLEKEFVPYNLAKQIKQCGGFTFKYITNENI